MSTTPWSLSPEMRRWKPFEIGAIVVGFLVYWPLGAAFLGWKLWKLKKAGAWDFPARSFGGFGFDPGFTSGNSAFDAYKRETLARLEEERRKLDEEAHAFAEFVEELKRAKDREEFDAFMAKRRNASTAV